MAVTQVRAQQLKDADQTSAEFQSAYVDGTAATACLRTLGTGSQQACAGNDSRLSDARTPVGTSLAVGKVWLGNGSNVAAAVGGTNGQLLIGNGSGFTVAALTGTSNQVTVTNGSGSITLSLPQSIATNSDVQFGKVYALKTTEQMRLAYDASNYATTTIDSSGNAAVALTGTTPLYSINNAVVITSAATSTIPLTVKGAGSQVGTLFRVTSNGGTVLASVDYTGALTLNAPLTAGNGGTGISSYTAGDILYASGATTLSKLAAGTAGKVLQMGASAPQWVGAPVLLDTKTASNSATIDFTSYIDSTYKMYVVEWDGVKSGSTGNGLQMRISTDGGSTWKSGASDYAYSFCYFSSGATTMTVQSSTATSSINCAVAVITTTANTSGSGTIKCFNPSDSARFFTIETSSCVTNTSTSVWTSRGVGNYTTAGAVNGFRFLMQSGNIVSGTFRLYGVP